MIIRAEMGNFEWKGRYPPPLNGRFGWRWRDQALPHIPHFCLVTLVVIMVVVVVMVNLVQKIVFVTLSAITKKERK